MAAAVQILTFVMIAVVYGAIDQNMDELTEMIIKEAQRLYYEHKFTFRKIAEILNITISEVVHYCTDVKYK